MAPNPTIMRAVEKLGYRVTVGDVATQAGLDINLAQQGLLALASDTSGHLQVAESGEVIYLFPKNFRTILRNKFWRLRLKETWEKIWRVLFYIIRISFGIVLLLSIVLIFVAIAVIVLSLNASSSNRDNDDRGYSGGGGGVFLPNFWFSPDFFWVFYPNYYERRSTQRSRARDNEPNQLNFLEAIFSFLFGDGNPNADLEDRRWQAIATVIRNQRGAVIAEQIAPYLDNLGQGYDREYEAYMIPVLSRFNGRPEVSPEGGIVYHFPELQTTVAKARPRSVAPFLEEIPWRFSAAGSGQILLAVGLGCLNLVGALVLGSLLADGSAAASLGGLVAFVQSIYWLLLGYGTAFLALPLVRYFWIQWRNRQIDSRNQTRRQQALSLNQANPDLQRKLTYAQQFAAETVIKQEDLVYTTETDLIEQDVERSAQIDAEWQQRLDESK